MILSRKNARSSALSNGMPMAGRMCAHFGGRLRSLFQALKYTPNGVSIKFLA